MKRTLNKSFTIALLLFFLIIANPSHADGPPPPPPGGGHGSAGNQPPGGGAPIGEGVALLMVLAAGYGIERMLTVRRKFSDETD